MDIVHTLHEYIAQNLLFSEDGFHYDDDASFLGEGIIDSVGVMEMVTFIGQEFGISVLDREIIPENFDSVNKLTQYIRSKLPKNTDWV
ncbi:MAG: acyl carrier protein [Anaerolineaceae bacterium]|nr:acyl carrier protein [Anaerolineaceae bacterium]NTV36574.1 acyl carrier protein [Anaerolineaceae bacterium]